MISRSGFLKQKSVFVSFRRFSGRKVSVFRLCMCFLTARK
jgi:hypothetical protein